MQSTNGLWILLAVLLFSSVTLGGVSVPTGMAPQQTVVDSVLELMDGTASTAGVRPIGWTRAGNPTTTAPLSPSSATPPPPRELAGSDPEEARLAQYVALHRGYATT